MYYFFLTKTKRFYFWPLWNFLSWRDSLYFNNQVWLVNESIILCLRFTGYLPFHGIIVRTSESFYTQTIYSVSFLDLVTVFLNVLIKWWATKTTNYSKDSEVPLIRSFKSGVKLQYWRCLDSSCLNEQFKSCTSTMTLL